MLIKNLFLIFLASSHVYYIVASIFAPAGNQPGPKRKITIKVPHSSTVEGTLTQSTVQKRMVKSATSRWHPPSPEDTHQSFAQKSQTSRPRTAEVIDVRSSTAGEQSRQLQSVSVRQKKGRQNINSIIIIIVLKVFTQSFLLPQYSHTRYV